MNGPRGAIKAVFAASKSAHYLPIKLGFDGVLGPEQYIYVFAVYVTAGPSFRRTYRFP